jgi:hypothetical protein
VNGKIPQPDSQKIFNNVTVAGKSLQSPGVMVINSRGEVSILFCVQEIALNSPPMTLRLNFRFEIFYSFRNKIRADKNKKKNRLYFWNMIIFGRVHAILVALKSAPTVN